MEAKKIRVLSYVPCHYGGEYMDASIRSIAPFVDKILIFYTTKPSYGHATAIPCPEHEEELKNIAFSASDKVVWISGYWGTEGDHRNEFYKYAAGYDVCVTFDMDEVFCQEDLPKSIEHVYNGDKKYYGVNGYINLWKSFNWEVKDAFRPIRFINLHNPESAGQGEVMQKIWHFSCAQRDVIMNYKYLCHGHLSELKPDWLNQFYYAWTPENRVRFLHPTSNEVWGDAFPYDKTLMPQILKQHHNYFKDVIR